MKEAGLIDFKCREPMLMVDALGEPRVRYTRVSYEGAHMVMTPEEATCYVQESQISGDETPYILIDTYLSEREFDELPEFDGF